jgi:tetratricopeptide (TPR) repeat protein
MTIDTNPRPTPLIQFWKQALEMLVRAVPIFAKLRRQLAEEHGVLASQAYADRRIDIAIQEFSKARELDPEQPQYPYELGRIYYGQSDLSKAESYFRQALLVDFSYADPLKGLAFTLHRLGKMDEAIYSYLRLLQKNPNDVDVHANLIAALEVEGKYDEAIKAAERAVKLFPSNAGLVVALGRNSYFAGKNETAILQLRKAIELDPNNSEIYRLLGIFLKTGGDLEGALSSFRTAVTKDPKNADAYLAVAEMCNRLNRNQEYLEASRKARQLFEAAKNDDGTKFACWNEGWALYKLGRWAESVQASECALKIDESFAVIRFNLGLALLRLGEVDRAKQEYQKATLSDLPGLTMGIEDLAAALRDNPRLLAAPEILQQLQDKYREVTSKRDEKLAVHQKRATTDTNSRDTNQFTTVDSAQR